MNNWKWVWGVLLCWLTLSASTAMAANQLNNVRFSQNGENTRLVLDLASKPKYDAFALSSPSRYVIDLENSRSKVALDKLKVNSKLVKKIRASKPNKKSDYRLVLDLNQSASVKHFTLAPAPPYGHRLVIDLAPSGAAASSQVVKQAPARIRDVVVAVDAGHGGRDPGAIGPKGTKEKVLVLEISNRLAKLINDTPGMRAVMVRSGDVYVDLNERSERARRADADILLSIHADAFHSPQPKGGGVFVLSDSRYTRETNKLLKSTDKHEHLVGVGEAIKHAEGGEDVAQWLIELNSVRSLEQARSAGQRIYAEMKKVTKMHRPRVEYKSLAVLKATDIPSLLIEAGFLSNPSEEKKLLTRSHQNRLVSAIHRGLVSHFENNPPEQTLFAKNASAKEVKYKVRSGDNLSSIAQVYGVSVTEIKRRNKLSSSQIRIGQTLVIPRR
ncbi:N-acetylmuramoyl-L-alanine amidase [Paraferrimonas sedimenticola]|uniref:N-acetylmuramoyl-L-alanine amidase n=1 Tax=Paraferrimonas sedimenticola TaxID=375674 RepID=A0AA37W121_9GAMM|nr:N-acetylmuramoyl-L-alanine amidase [Paraferrimonas sedimenticola]GLP95742.1 N-acetylmuramoyl-L-alanine amidase [Paraferrimonas sedimenticola]